MTDMTKLENTSHARSSSQNQTGRTFDLQAGHLILRRASIAEAHATTEFSSDIDAALNEALKGTFPASDPISSLRVA
jgi:hypothetical protein